MNQKLVLFTFLGVVAAATAQTYFEEDIGAWHFHTYFFDLNPSKTAEALAFRRALREQIDNGTLTECSLNQIHLGVYGPHSISQWECCCNKTSFNAAHSWHTQNHGNLSVLLHPLTIYDQEDHLSRASWLGKEVILDVESPFLFPVLPKVRPCPVYPRYSDELPEDRATLRYETPIPGTEDYENLNKNFDILNDPY